MQNIAPGLTLIKSQVGT